MDVRAKSRYPEIYARSQRDPEGFWAEAAEAIDWYETPKAIFDPKAGVYGRWFTDGVCNTCFYAIDRHVGGGRGEQPAIIYDSPVTDTERSITYS
jgi:propionyl-CoA synthetase